MLWNWYALLCGIAAIMRGGILYTISPLERPMSQRDPALNIASADKYDAQAFRRQRIATTSGKYAWSRVSGDSDAKLAWRCDFREEFSNALGGLTKWEKVPLNPKVNEVVQLDGYKRERISFDTRVGLRAYGYLLIPDGARLPLPAVVCIPGHGRGVATCVGIRPDGSQRALNNPDEYSADFALQCVSSGFAAFAIESISFGERCDVDLQAKSKDASSCSRDASAALMLGETVAGWRVWDAMRAIDYLETRVDLLNPAQIGAMGISGGGLVSLFLAALDERIAATVVSGYFNTFANSVLSIDHCIDNFVPGLLKLCEMYDLAGLTAPRALFVESGTEDPIFPVKSFMEAVEHAKRIYQDSGMPEAFGYEVFEGGHQFYGKGAFEFLKSIWK